MDDSTLLIAIVGALTAGITAYLGNALNTTRPLPAGLIVQKAFQPRQQGAPSAPAIIVNHARNVPRGFPNRKSVWDPNASQMNFNHRQRFESTYHIEALVPQSPANYTAMTESDVLNIARYILQNDLTLGTFATLGVSLLRIAQLDSNYIEDDADQNENVPFFEVTFVYEWVISDAAPTVDEFVEIFSRV